MKNGKGSKLLLGLIIQGAVLGSLVLYNRFKGEKPADDLSSTIDELEKKEQNKAQEQAQSKEQPKTEKAESLADELLHNIENFGKVAKDTVETIKPTLNLVDEVVNAFKKEVNNAAKTSAKPEEAQKEETPKPQSKSEEKPVVKPQAKAEEKQAPTAPVTKVQEPSKEVTGNRTTKTASQVDEDFLTRITSYGQQAEKPAEDVVVAKNKVNLPKPPTAQKQDKPAATKKVTKPVETQKPAAQVSKPKTKPSAPKKVTKPAENKNSKPTEAKKD